MKKIFAFAVVALMMLAIPAAAANYKLNGSFTGGYTYANETGTDKLGLTLEFHFDEAGIMTAYAPLTLSGGLAVTDGWWVQFLSAPLNLVVSDNNDDYYWEGLEETFSLNLDSTFSYDDIDNEGNRYSKVWGDLSPNLSYAAQVVMDDESDWLVSESALDGDDYKISAQVVAGLPLGLTLTSDFGWLYEQDAYYMGLSTSLTGAIPVIGGKFQVAVGNFADLDQVLVPGLWFWNSDDVWAFAAYAGVKEIGLGPVTIDEISYKMSMPGVADDLLDEDSPSFYVRDLQEVTTNATAKIGPVKVVFKNGVWFQSFNALGGNNANLNVSATVGPVALALDIVSRLNWVGPLAHGESVELKADYTGLIGKLGGKLGYISNWDGVQKYGFGTANDKVYGSVYYDAAMIPLHLEAYGSFDQKGTNTATAGIYAKYENTYTTVPYVVDLKALVAGRFGYVWTEDPTHTMEAIGMLKLDSTINGLWKAGLMFISKNAGSPKLSLEPIVSAYAIYKASDIVTVTGRITYRAEDLFPSSTPTPVHAVYALLQGDIKVSDNANATVYWGNSGLKSVSSSHADYSKPWGPYFNTVDPMYWDSFGATFTIKF